MLEKFVFNSAVLFSLYSLSVLFLSVVNKKVFLSKDKSPLGLEWIKASTYWRNSIIAYLDVENDKLGFINKGFTYHAPFWFCYLIYGVFIELFMQISTSYEGCKTVSDFIINFLAHKNIQTAFWIVCWLMLYMTVRFLFCGLCMDNKEFKQGLPVNILVSLCFGSLLTVFDDSVKGMYTDASSLAWVITVTVSFLLFYATGVVITIGFYNGEMNLEEEEGEDTEESEDKHLEEEEIDVSSESLETLNTDSEQEKQEEPEVSESKKGGTLNLGDISKYMSDDLRERD